LVQSVDSGVVQVEGLQAIGPFDSQQAIARAHVPKKESAARADFENADELRSGSDVLQPRAAAPAFLDLSARVTAALLRVIIPFSMKTGMWRQ
jgi:hypothetical protein